MLPQVSQNVDVDGRQQVIRQKQTGLYNKHVKDLPVSEPNDVVRVRKDNKWETKGYVIVQLSPRSYKIRTEDGRVIRRNRRQLMKTIESCNNSGSTLSIDVDSSKSASNDHSVSTMSEASMSDTVGDSDGDNVTLITHSGDQGDDHGVVTDHDIEDTLAIPRGQESNLDSIRKSGRMTNKPERYGMNSYDFKTFG